MEQQEHEKIKINGIEIQCAFKALVELKKLKPHPKNRNKHPENQIERLAKIFQYQGIRSPIKVSTRSGFITAGHGRLLAAKKLGLDKMPVDFQDYETEEQEIADLTADNAIALWADLDMSGLNFDLGELGPAFDIELFGLKDFTIDVAEKMKDDAGINPEFKNALQVNLDSEEATAELYQELKHRGLQVKVLSL